MSNAIKDLNVSFSSAIDFEVEWHNSWSDSNQNLSSHPEFSISFNNKVYQFLRSNRIVSNLYGITFLLELDYFT